MLKLLKFFERNVNSYPDKPAIVDKESTTTYKQLYGKSLEIAFILCNRLHTKNQPIAILLEKGSDIISTILGVMYSGNFYSPIDVKSPAARIDKIISQLKPSVIITKKQYNTLVSSQNELIFIDEISFDSTLDILIDTSKTKDTDPAYVLFTSGSTGIPKGVVTPHICIDEYTNWAIETFNITKNTIFGNQAPLHYVNSVFDIFSSLKIGATVHLINERLFTFPKKLMQYIEDNKIDLIFWVPSVLSMVADMKVFDDISLTTLKKVLFCGEPMPTKQLNYWRANLPQTVFANLYGATETTDASCYYVIDSISDNKAIPLGKARKNVSSYIISDDDEIVVSNGKGELYISGICVTYGYYNDQDKTNSVFVQNPKNSKYREMLYKTGDIVSVDENGVMTYLCRKDYQIKHMGHRIEPGEIECVINAFDGVEKSCVQYDNISKQIVAFYQAKNEINKECLVNFLMDMLPNHMIPSDYVYFKNIPENINGKIDRAYLRSLLNKDTIPEI